MSSRVFVRRLAEEDIEAAANYLDSKRPGAGKHLLLRFQAILRMLSTMPEMHALVWRDVRAARIARSEYIVYYRVLLDRVDVFAVFHGKRDDAEWRTRANDA